MKNKVVLFCFEQDSWWLFHVIWHLPSEIFSQNSYQCVEDWDEAIDDRVLSFRDWTLASLIWKTSRVSMRTRWTYARKISCALQTCISQREKKILLGEITAKILPNWKMWSTVNTARRSLKHLAQISRHVPSLRSFGSVATQVKVKLLDRRNCRWFDILHVV